MENSIFVKRKKKWKREYEAIYGGFNWGINQEEKVGAWPINGIDFDSNSIVERKIRRYFGLEKDFLGKLNSPNSNSIPP